MGTITGAGLVERLGGHPAAALGLDLERPEDRERWWIAACLLSLRASEAVSRRGFGALSDAGLGRLEAIAARPAEAAAALAGAEVPDAEKLAARLARAARVLAEEAGNLDSLAAAADDTVELASRLARLAPGIGAAAVLRFLRPLRDVWRAAGEVPIVPAARAAAVHLGLLAEGEDEEGEPGALRAALARDEDAPQLADVEAALERLGRAACLRERVDRCPLAADCPRRG